MSYTFLQAQGEESSAECFSDIPACALSRSAPIAAQSSCNGKETEFYRDSRSGTIYAHSMENRGAGKSASLAADSHAKESVAETLTRKDSTIQRADSGENKPASFAKFNHDLFLWRTPHYSASGGYGVFCGTWPQWGTMQDGECLELQMPAEIISESGYGYLPRPQHSDGKKWYVVKQTSAQKRLTDGRQLMLIHVVGLTAYDDLSAWWANPPFWEAMMAWPIGWTALEPLETDKIREWLHSHGISSLAALNEIKANQEKK